MLLIGFPAAVTWKAAADDPRTWHLATRVGDLVTDFGLTQGLAVTAMWGIC